MTQHQPPIDRVQPIRYVAFDTETTGLSPVEDRVVELAALSFDARGVAGDWFEQLIQPLRPIPAELSALHGIDDAMVAGAPPLSEVMPRFLSFIEGSVLVAHNAPYDIAMLLVPLVRAAGPGAPPGNLVLDTCALSRVLFPGAPSYRLQTIAGRLGVAHTRAHRARSDVEACHGLFLKILEAAGGSAGPEELERRAGVRLRFGLQEELLDLFISGGTRGRFEALRDGLRRCRPVTIEYRGGTKGEAPRQVTPIALQEQEGIVCLLGNCHLDGTLKSFRLDRIGRVAPVAT